ncbi:helix-turn-helix domain-containing protein [Billgrantia bachuensis]|uniref:Helix-turn-helix domain-containing protein n=1 Tax=Billgrantia bachuensis TaxID=2717286 RepID=A0ABX0PQ96_9GAMM|nr:helix-turn-helix transcriptional regulator [Halomonas bachuensis]NIC05355.1 helix-turn-helix domain-containing protein [Halomonas bachuensis]
MRKFCDTVRELRQAQNLSLRETASMSGISPAYLSRIERGKEPPPSPAVIKSIAKVLAADPDVLFRLSESTDPEISHYLVNNPCAVRLLRLISDQNFTDQEIGKILNFAEKLKKN